MTVRIIVGDALAQLKTLDAESVQCCVTSPPYYGLRDYGTAGQMGLEATPDAYVAGMVAVFREVRRVLRDDGTLWLNLGDSYASAWPAPKNRRNIIGQAMNGGKRGPMRTSRLSGDLKEKDLIGIPWMLAFALRADGWWLRSDIIWAKTNPMPESVTDRCTRSHEFVFHLSKSANYYHDAEAIREPSVEPERVRDDVVGGTSHVERGQHSPGGRFTRDKQRGHSRRHAGFNGRWDSMTKEEQAVMGRNKRDVWTIATHPYPDAHFATMPPELAETCIKAGTPERTCEACSAPWRRDVERAGYTGERADDSVYTGRAYATPQSKPRGPAKDYGSGTAYTRGWLPTCDCEPALNIGMGKATVLDPFGGAGTTGLVADRLGRDALLIELNPKYAAMAERRIRDDSPIFASVAVH